MRCAILITREKPDLRARYGLRPSETPEEAAPNSLVASIPGLSKDVPRCGADWFVLERKPTAEEKKTLNAAGYRAKQEKGDWVWRLKS